MRHTKITTSLLVRIAMDSGIIACHRQHHRVMQWFVAWLVGFKAYRGMHGTSSMHLLCIAGHWVSLGFAYELVDCRSCTNLKRRVALRWDSSLWSLLQYDVLDANAACTMHWYKCCPSQELCNT